MNNPDSIQIILRPEMKLTPRVPAVDQAMELALLLPVDARSDIYTVAARVWMKNMLP